MIYLLRKHVILRYLAPTNSSHSGIRLHLCTVSKGPKSKVRHSALSGQLSPLFATAILYIVYNSTSLMTYYTSFCFIVIVNHYFVVISKQNIEIRKYFQRQSTACCRLLMRQQLVYLKVISSVVLLKRRS